MVIYLFQSLASPHYEAVPAPLDMTSRKWLAQVAPSVDTAAKGAAAIKRQMVRA
ncbi:hypothetical protein [Herbaspirillum sp. YR522]|uniref:hypothetical protein n=1 Tax=Herbaspirillum sp. YR522 TaxID=1144342 RepID=UPI0012F93B3B|nr:hypothetical protein [Herbaspirillum sp. YR522]